MVNESTEGYCEAVAGFRTRMVKLAASIVGYSDAEDVVQTAIIRAWRGTKETPRSWQDWLFRCTVNAAVSHKRRLRREPQVLSVDEIMENRL